MASKSSAAALKAKADKFIDDTIKNRIAKTRAEHKALIDSWIDTTAENLDKILVAEADKGRPFYVLTSSIFENHGMVEDADPTKPNKRVYLEKEFRNYLKSLVNIQAELAKHVGSGITITEIAEPAVAASAPEPKIPANVVFRYKISW